MFYNIHLSILKNVGFRFFNSILLYIIFILHPSPPRKTAKSGVVTSHKNFFFRFRVYSLHINTNGLTSVKQGGLFGCVVFLCSFVFGFVNR